MDFYLNLIEVYTDGSNKPNPGKSGHGIVIYYPDGEEIEISPDGFKVSTINRTELRACIQALEYIKLDKRSLGISLVRIYSDSQYVVDGYKRLLFGDWGNEKWQTKDGDDIANQDLWKDLMRKVRTIKKKVEIHKVKAHSGIEGNEKADHLAEISREKASNIDHQAQRTQVRRYLKIPKNNTEIKIKTLIVFIQRIIPRKTQFDAHGQILKPEKNRGCKICLRGNLGKNIIKSGHIYKMKLEKTKDLFRIKEIKEHLGTPMENEKMIRKIKA